MSPLERNLSEVAKSKNDIFKFSPEYDGSVYEDFKVRLDEAFSQKEEKDKVNKFLALWAEVETYPEAHLNKSGKLPAIAVAELFERSLSFFHNETTLEARAQIAKAQASMLATLADSELRNLCLGIWSFNTDPAKLKLALSTDPTSDESVFRKSVNEAMILAAKTESSKEEKDREIGALKYLAMAENDSFNSAPEADDLHYFSQLYEHDEQAIEINHVDERPDIDIRQLDPKKRKPLPPVETSVSMPPYVRLLTFEGNMVPTAESISAGKTDLFLTDNPEVFILRRERTMEIVSEPMPAELMLRYLTVITSVRFSKDYQKFKDDKDKRRAMRYEAAEQFITQLLIPDSMLNEELKKEIGEERFASLEKSLLRYKDGAAHKFLFFALKVNYNLQSGLDIGPKI